MVAHDLGGVGQVFLRGDVAAIPQRKIPSRVKGFLIIGQGVRWPIQRLENVADRLVVRREIRFPSRICRVAFEQLFVWLDAGLEVRQRGGEVPFLFLQRRPVDVGCGKV